MAKDYFIELKEVQRQGAGPLLDTICEIVDMIDGKEEIHALSANEQFYRGVNIADHIKIYKPTDFAVLAFTNRRVEELNAIINKELPETDMRWSPTLRSELEFKDVVVQAPQILTHSGILLLDSKYKTLEHLYTMEGIQFGEFYNHTAEETQIIAYVFGHYKFKQMNDALATEAANSNAEIDHINPKRYCAENPRCKECRRRAKAWRDYLTFKECVMCVDYPYAQTVHKSQGSTYDSVYIDNEDLKLLMKINSVKAYLQLLYVAVSRASDKVYMNS